MKSLQAIPYPSYTSTQRDALVGVIEGYIIKNTTTGSYQMYNGSVWITYTGNLGTKAVNETGLVNGTMMVYDSATDKFIVSLNSKVVTIGTGGTYTTLKSFLESNIDYVGIIISNVTETQLATVVGQKYLYNSGNFTITNDSIGATQVGVTIPLNTALTCFNCNFSFITTNTLSSFGKLFLVNGVLNLNGKSSIIETGFASLGSASTIMTVAGTLNFDNLSLTTSYTTFSESAYAPYITGIDVTTGYVNGKYLKLIGVHLKCMNAFKGNVDTCFIDTIEVIGTWSTGDAYPTVVCGVTSNYIFSLINCIIGFNTTTVANNVVANKIYLPLGSFISNYNNKLTNYTNYINALNCINFAIAGNNATFRANINNFTITAIPNSSKTLFLNASKGYLTSFNNSLIAKSTFTDVTITNAVTLAALQNGSVFDKTTFNSNVTIDSTANNITLDNCTINGNLVVAGNAKCTNVYVTGTITVSGSSNKSVFIACTSLGDIIDNGLATQILAPITI